MYLWILGALAVLVVGMVSYVLEHPRTVEAPVLEQVASSTDTTTEPVSTTTTGVFTLALGETGESHGWSVTPVKLLEDSRCPADVQCIQAGTVRVSVRVMKETTTEESLTLLTPTLIKGGKITLLTVAPAPNSATPLQSGEYRFSFLVEVQ